MPAPSRQRAADDGCPARALAAPRPARHRRRPKSAIARRPTTASRCAPRTTVPASRPARKAPGRRARTAAPPRRTSAAESCRVRADERGQERVQLPDTRDARPEFRRARPWASRRREAPLSSAGKPEGTTLTCAALRPRQMAGCWRRLSKPSEEVSGAWASMR